MRITIIYSAYNGRDYGLRKAAEAIGETLSELGCEVEAAELSEGARRPSTAGADGFVLLYTAELGAPNPRFQEFLASLGKESAAFKGKHVMTAAACERSGAERSLAYVGYVLASWGAVDDVRIALSRKMLDSFEDIKETVEKYAEDFYRITRQNRACLLPEEEAEPAGGFTEEDVKTVLSYGKPGEGVDFAEKYNFEEFDRKQEEDIEQITRFFAGKYKESVAKSANIELNSLTEAPAAKRPKRDASPPPPREKTTKQLTQSLVRHFQPQLSNGLSAVIQFNITGEENFDAHIKILNAECEYAEGEADSPDLTVICGAGVWRGVLTGKMSAQKAFMIGHIKVRGQFVLLTRFDQMFSITK
ncbi:MAG: SCP2 sterol-binding domain-containing protein [Clostridiales bacterium]|jgi:putative sterol carrier protein|nr:SCP2 sterol-binding domain-containing protein [Clostridiales bacterium]